MNKVIDAVNLLPERIIISNKTNKGYQYKKVDIRTYTNKNSKEYQISSYTDKQVFQKNVTVQELIDEITDIFPDNMGQINMFFEDYELAFKASKSGKILSHKNMSASMAKKNTDHNRKKNYILEEGKVIPPLVDMGIFTKEGKVVKSMYDKFKQINRFVELVDDVVRTYNKKEINIIDFGCGKSYLTFILYYYLVEIKNIKANIVGLDLKEDVIEKCNKAAKKYGYSGLRFEMGNIEGYKNDAAVDMVVTLHACDTATDFALYNAVIWNAKYILSVPCCQHEVNKQIKNDTLASMLKHGIIKDRFSALATDAVRGNMLEYHGYKTTIMEFVDIEHSPKNILIRAIKSNIPLEKKKTAYNEAINICEFLNIEPTIVKLLK